MKRLLQFLTPAVVVLLSIAAAHADGVDPGIIIRDPVGCPSHQCVPITGLSFTFAVPEKGFGVLHFLNDSGVRWHSLLLTEVGVPAIEVKCSSDIFSCSVVALGTDGAKIVLTAIHDQPGIPAGNSFEIVLGCSKGNCPHWPAGLEFTAVANVPEPAALLLLSTGLGLIAMAARRRKSSKPTSFS